MSFSPQMLAVMQTIFEFRHLPPGSENSLPKDGGLPERLPDAPEGWNPGDKRKLNESAVERRAQRILKPNQKTVRRQSWIGCGNDTQGQKVIWHRIKRAIEGQEALPGHDEIEEQIASFGGEDILREIIKRLRQEIEEKEAEIFKLKDGRRQFEENFRNRAYTEQFIKGELLSEFNDYKKTYEAAQLKLANEENLRQKLELQNANLRQEVRILKTMAKNVGMTETSSATRKNLVNHSPKLTGLSKDSQTPMLDYYRLRDEAWDALIGKAGGNAPDYIFFVFHNFNIDVEAFIESKLNPIVPAGAINFVFACHQPNIGRRKSMSAEAKYLCKMQPVAYYVLGSPPPSNVTDIRTGSRDVREELHKQVSHDLLSRRPKIDSFNPVREGFQVVRIERVDNE